MAISAHKFKEGALDGTTTAVFYVSICSFVVSFLNICLNFPKLLAEKERELKAREREREVQALVNDMSVFSQQLTATTKASNVLMTTYFLRHKFLNITL